MIAAWGADLRGTLVNDHRAYRVAFVAGLTPSPSGAAGGQLSVATTLLNSGLSRAVELLPISSTSDSVPVPPLWRRATVAAGRLARFSRTMRDADVALIFAADGLSLVEKGVMCVIARSMGKGVVVRLSSGALPEQCRRSAIIRNCLRATLSAADVVCSQGAAWTRFFGSFAEAGGKIVEVPNPVELSSAERAVRPVRRFAFVGWVTSEKGIHEALAAVEALSPRFPDLRLIIAGGGRDLEAFRAALLTRNLVPLVETLGWVPRERVRRLLETEVDALILPSHYEGLPNAMLEGMAAGLPCIVSRVGSVRDVLIHGENGLIVEPRDAAGLASAMESLMQDSEAAVRMGQAARRTIEMSFATDRVWPQYQAAIHRAALAAAARRARMAD
jgi:glycosyltransferase involved in cell wall biosynthesis